MTSPREHVQRLYRHHHGYFLSDAEERRVVRTGSSSTYGEIRPGAVGRLLEQLTPSRRDVVYDLGSGIGKVVLQVALTCRVERVVGVELVRSRHEIAERVLERARERGLLVTKDVQLRCADLMRTPMDDATIVYTCSTAFPDPFMRRLARRLAKLRPGLRLVTTQELDPPGRFVPRQVLRLPMTWNRAGRVHVYRLGEPRRRRSR